MTSMVNGSKRVYFENLNGLRFLCFLSLFFFHSFHTEFDYILQDATYQFVKHRLFGNGNLGVNFFFVLSGFLITYLLIQEKQLNGQIDVPRFWLRRILRIWPLYFFCVGFGFWIFPYLKMLFGQTPNETAHLWAYLTFVSNFDLIRNGLPDASVLGVLWSIAVEEQFYLVWPLLLFLMPVHRYYLAFGTVICVSLLFRATHDQAILLEHHSLSCMGDMAIGALGAWSVAQVDDIRQWISSLSRPMITIIYVLFFSIFFFREELFFQTYFLRVIERPLIASIMLLIILEQCYAHKAFFKLEHKWLSYLGNISYGLYCYHFFGILITTTLTRKLGFNTALWQVMIVECGVSLLLTIVIATISYRFVEKPILEIKKRFAYITQ